MAFSDLTKEVLSPIAVQTLAEATGKFRYFTTNFTPQGASQYSGVQVAVYDLTAAQFVKDTNDWCDGETPGGLVIPLEKHSIAGIALPDTGIQTASAAGYGETDANVAQIVRDASIGIIRALEKDITTNIYGKFTTSNIKETPVEFDTGSMTYAKWGSLVATAATKFDVTNGVMILDSATFYGDFLPCLPSNVVYVEKDPVDSGVVKNVMGLKAVICIPNGKLGSSLNGAIVAPEAFGIVSRYNAPAINGYFDTFKVTTEDGFTVGFRAFENLCQGEMKFAGDCLYGSKFLHIDATTSKATGVLPLIADTED